MRKVKMTLFLFLTLVIILGCDISKDKGTMLDDECLPVLNEFFTAIHTGNYADALSNLLKSNPDIDRTDSGTIDLQEKFENINEVSGKYVGYKVIRKRGIDNDVAIYSCLVKYQKKFYRYIFIFYKAEARAKIFKFLFDDSIDLELEESLKLYVQ